MGSAEEEQDISETTSFHRQLAADIGRKNPSADSIGTAPMPLDLTQSEANGIHILRLNGQLVSEDECSLYLKIVKGLITSGVKKLVVNLQHADQIDEDAGLGTLLHAALMMRRNGGRLTYCNLTPSFQRELRLMQLFPPAAFEIFTTEATALKSFEHSGEAPGRLW